MVEGGHIAEIFDKRARVSPLWIPPWPSMEPSNYRPHQHPEYGLNSESQLLAGIMGHNLCLDLFGPPSDSEADAGLTVHGEGSVAAYEFKSIPNGLLGTCSLAKAGLTFERRLQLLGRKLLVEESIENLLAYDRPIAWQQHVTLGPPFLEKGKTQLRAPATRAAVMESEEAFDWPNKPEKNGTTRDLRTFTSLQSSSGFTTQLLDAAQPQSFAFAFSPTYELVLGYVWQTSDFPWLGLWEENYARPQAPWNTRTLTLGLEFGTTPFPETRQKMIDRGSLFGVPAYRWIRAGEKLRARYWAALVPAREIPESLEEFEHLLA